MVLKERETQVGELIGEGAPGGLIGEGTLGR